MLYQILDELQIKYKEIEHPPVYTVEDINNLNIQIDGLGLKNLFVKDKFNNRYLIAVKDDKKVDLKKLKENLEINKLSFCKEDELKEILNLTPGSVTPLGIINDKNKEVTVILDEDMINQDILIHPLVNTKTMKINYNDLLKIFDNRNTNYIVCEIPQKHE